MASFHYSDFNIIQNQYLSLHDRLSKELYLIRIQLDIQFNPTLLERMVSLSEPNFKNHYFSVLSRNIKSTLINNTPVYIYGAGRLGKKWLEYLCSNGITLTGSYDKNYKKIQELNGIPVSPPPNTNDGGYILITAVDYISEIEQHLLSVGYRPEQILKCYPQLENDLEHQYFDFMEYYDSTGAFVDAGCYDCGTVLHFLKKSGGKYSKIFSFEPDAKNMEICRQIAEHHRIERFELCPYGLSASKGNVRFNSTGTSSSCISDEGMQSISLITLDEVVGETYCSFIKMDIEGEEFAALQGAKKTIQRDKPLCAISVYHRPGDIIVIMDYLKQLVPEYTFAVRHYSNVDSETVLYAFVK